MDKLFKQCVGIDISKGKFTACLCKYYISDLQNQSDVVEFENNKTGFNQFVKWSRKCMDKESPLLYLMEATGVYYESLSYHLNKLSQPVCVVLPNKAKYYVQSLGIKTGCPGPVNDGLLAEATVVVTSGNNLPATPVFMSLPFGNEQAANRIHKSPGSPQ
jgi:hypothetical protein